MIDSQYDYTPVGFTNGSLENAPGENVGSCKLVCLVCRSRACGTWSHLDCLRFHVQLFWAQMHGLSSDEVLFAFGRHYRDLEPGGTSHQNIRSIIANGIDGVRFSSPPLSPKEQASGGLPPWAAADTGMRRHISAHVLQFRLLLCSIVPDRGTLPRPCAVHVREQ